MDQRKKTGRVEIEVRTGNRARSGGGFGDPDEKYPFGELGMGELLDGNIRGGVSGPCFFIPGNDKPDYRLTLAKKRYPDVTFVSRSATKDIDGVRVPGAYVWKVPPLSSKPYQRQRRVHTPANAFGHATEVQRRDIEFTSSVPHPETPTPANDTTQLVLRYLLEHERAPHKWMGRASTLRKFRT